MVLGDWGLVSGEWGVRSAEWWLLHRSPVNQYWRWIEMAIERDIYGHPKRPKWEKLILLLIAAGVAFVVAGGYDLFFWFMDMYKNQGKMP